MKFVRLGQIGILNQRKSYWIKTQVNRIYGGGGVDIATKIIDCNSFINIRPRDNNASNEIQNQVIRKKFEDLAKYFFKNIL